VSDKSANHVKPYHPAIDAMRLIAILAVILIHTTNRNLEIVNLNMLREPLAFLLNQAARFAVPLFFIISGFVLELSFSVHQSYLSYFKKRISRIAVPYVLWSAVYYFFIYREHSKNFLEALVHGEASYQLYFIPSLLIFYLAFPLLHSVRRWLANPIFLVALGMVQWYILQNDYSVHPRYIFYAANVALFNLFPFIIGIVAAHHQKIFSDWSKKLAIICIPAAFYIGNFVIQQGQEKYLKTYNYLDFYSQWRGSVLLYTLFTGIGMYGLFELFDRKLEWVKSVSKLSFLVFFIHVIVLETVWKYWQLPPVGFFAAVTIISFGIAFLVHRIPGIEKLTG
jgi:probable poly-beta-1,6-N-acetyl-D-glucosamine export protein